VRCAAAGRLATSIARLGQSTLGGHGRRIWELQLGYEVDGVTFGAREEFIFGGKREGFLRWLNAEWGV
jgi:hypothetical protein